MRRWLLAALTLTLITSCGAPAARPSAAPGEEPAPGAAPKTLIVGVQREPADLGVLFGAYNGFGALAAVCIPFMVRRFGLQVSHLINLWLGALSLTSFLSLPLTRMPPCLRTLHCPPALNCSA